MKYLPVLLSFLLYGCTDVAETPLPNVIFIMMDDLGYGDLSCFGNDSIQTPVMDRLAKEGLKLTSHYTVYPVCSPARAAFLTGFFPVRTQNYQVYFPEAKGGLPDTVQTVAELFQTAGYQTTMIGKWHLGSQPQHLPQNHGFDSWFGTPYSNDMDPPLLMMNQDTIKVVEDQSEWTSQYTVMARDLIIPSEKPFFLYLAHTMPHIPIKASENFAGKSEGGLYGDVIEELDYHIGVLLEELQKAGKLENTMVVLTSDNGPWLGLGNQSGSAGKLAHGKFSTWEGGVRVPCIVWWPGMINAGTESDVPIDLLDWKKTFADLLNLPATGDGASMLPLLTNQGDAPDSLVCYFSGTKLEGIRNGKWKLKLPSEGVEWAGIPPNTLSLFNLEVDAGETINLVDQYPKEAEMLMALVSDIYATLPKTEEPEKATFGSPF